MLRTNGGIVKALMEFFALGGNTSAAASAEAKVRDFLPLMLGLALVMGLLARTASGWTAPYWLDENFTLVIASQPDLAHLIDWMLHEMSGPVYYTMLWVWGLIAGNGDLAMRVPSFICSVATPLIVLFGDYADRRTKMLWAALLALWPHAFAQATEARPYALLALLSAAQTISYLRLLQMPSAGRAATWVGLCGLAVLTNYYAAVIAGIQGLLFVASMPRAAFRVWPTILLLIPVLAWMSMHLPFVLGYATSGDTWYTYLSPWVVPHLLGALIGLGRLANVFVAGMLMWGALELGRMLRGQQALNPQSRAYVLTAMSAMLAILLVAGLGTISRSFTLRYLIPYAPPLLFGVAWWLTVMDGRFGRLTSTFMLAIAVGLALPVLRSEIQHPELDGRYALNFEQPSQWFLDHDATRRLVFFWDNPTADFSTVKHLDEVGGFFLRRAGAHPQVLVPRMARNVDPNAQLLALAGGNKGSAILWAYDATVPYSRGIKYPARLSAIDPRWTCRNFGRGNITVLACVHR